VGFGVVVCGGWSSHRDFGYPSLAGKPRDEVDGLQAGINYLEKLEPETRGNYLGKLISFPSISSDDTWEDHDPLSWCAPDLDLTVFNDPTVAWPAPPSNDSSGYPNNLFTLTPPPEGLTSSSYLFGPPTVPEYQHEDQRSADLKTDDLTKNKKLPRATQWASLRELRLPSRLQYMKFLGLTAKYESRGIKKLRRMYGSAIGMLDTGIMTFRDVLDGQEPNALKEVFAFTCLSYVMSKILQKHGRMEGSHVLADTGRWR
jgi:hypothetical protein